MADEVKHEHTNDNPTNWGQGLTGASVGVLALTELLKGVHGGGIGSGNTTLQSAMELSEAKSRIAMLEQNAATRNALTDTLYAMDKRLTKVETEGPLREQIVLSEVNKVATLSQNGIAANASAIAALAATVNSVTHVVIKNTDICPGWGSVTVTPQGSFPFPPAPAAQPTAA